MQNDHMRISKLHALKIRIRKARQTLAERAFGSLCAGVQSLASADSESRDLPLADAPAVAITNPRQALLTRQKRKC